MKKILIIEDETAYLNLLRSKLAANGYQVFEAVNGKTGLEVAKKENPDLILLDIKMPVMGGMEMLSLLRKEIKGEKIKVDILNNIEPDLKIIEGAIDDHAVYFL